MAKQKKTDAVLELPVAYGRVGFGDRTASVGMSIDRANLEAQLADQSFCCRRLTGTIMRQPRGWDAAQKPLPGTADDMELSGIFDVASLSLTSKKIGMTLTFALDGLDVQRLASFAKCEGRITITGIAPLPNGEGGDDEDSE